jgi:undecaprenyl diphosphate synthase
MSVKEQINPSKLPRHIAIIMDGNGRWAKQQGMLRIFGHQHGVEAVRDTVEACAELGIQYLTLYAFSTENWNRPRIEIDALMELLVASVRKELKTMTDNNIRLLAVGDLKSLPEKCRAQLQEAIDKTKTHTRMSLVLALSYSSRWELTEAVKAAAKDVRDGKISVEALDENTFRSYFDSAHIPDPELLIRTRENTASATSCCGKLHTPNSISLPNSGPISAGKIYMKPSLTTKPANEDSAK